MTDKEILGVEYECNFQIDGHDCIGYIDLLYRTPEGITVLDHKSSEYPLTKAGKVKKDQAHKFEMYKYQLYLYSKAVYEKFGEYPKKLMWNYFKSGQWVTIDFDITEYENAIKWASDTIKDIYSELFFDAKDDFFYCHNLCGYREVCEFANGGR